METAMIELTQVVIKALDRIAELEAQVEKLARLLNELAEEVK